MESKQIGIVADLAKGTSWPLSQRPDGYRNGSRTGDNRVTGETDGWIICTVAIRHADLVGHTNDRSIRDSNATNNGQHAGARRPRNSCGDTCQRKDGIPSDAIGVGNGQAVARLKSTPLESIRSRLDLKTRG